VLASRRARRSAAGPDLGLLKRAEPLRHVEVLAFAAALAAGFWLMSHHGYRLGYPRWLSAKLGLVAFLLTPLQAFRAYIQVAWLGPGLRGSTPGSVSRELERALSMEEMLQALGAPLLLLGLPAILWLSYARPF
jgi:hypothetical protein